MSVQLWLVRTNKTQTKLQILLSISCSPNYCRCPYNEAGQSQTQDLIVTRVSRRTTCLVFVILDIRQDFLSQWFRVVTAGWVRKKHKRKTAMTSSSINSLSAPLQYTLPVTT